MKRTQIRDLFANIKATFVSFFSIAMFVSLAVAIFLGIDWSGKALQSAAENAFDEGSFHDVEILFPYGLTDNDVEALRQTKGVSEVAVGRLCFQTIEVDDDEYTMRVGTSDTNIDKLKLVEGELPQKSGEIALEAMWARRHDVEVGGELLLIGDEDEKETLKTDKFVVTALVECPAFLSNSANTWGASNSSSGSLDLLAWVPSQSFDAEAFDNAYSWAGIRSDSLRGKATMSDDYVESSDVLKERLEEVGRTQAYVRKEDINADLRSKVNDAKQALDDAQKELDDGEKKISEAETKIADGEKDKADAEAKIKEADQQYAEASQKISDGWAQFATTEAELQSKKSEFEQEKASGAAEAEEARAKIADAQATYDSARAELDAQWQSYNDANAQLDAAEAALDPTSPTYVAEGALIRAKRNELVSVRAQLNDAENQLAQTKTAIDNGNVQYQATIDAYEAKVAEAQSKIDSAQAQIDSGRATLESSQAQLAEKKAELDSAKEELAQKSKELEDAKRELSQKKDELKDAKAKLADKSKDYEELEQNLEDAINSNIKWTVLSRSENGGVFSVLNFVDIASRLRTSMASLFVAVGLLVCYSAVSRLVREQVRLIGTKKALGLRAKEVSATYLLYAGSAVAFGMVFGVAGAIIVVERIIVPVLSSSFYMKTPVWWSVSEAALFGLVELVLILASTGLACRSVLSRNAVDLLNGAQTHRSKERFFESWKAWKRLPLYSQTTINNLFNDRRRVIGTLVGVAGCTALVVCAVTLNNDVMAGFDAQYRDVYHYDIVVRTNPDVEGSLEDTASVLKEMGCEVSRPVGTRAIALNLPDEKTTHVTITVPKDMNDFSRTVTLTSTMGDTAGQAVTPDDSGAWVSNAYADHYGVKPGDELKVTSGNGTVYSIPIAGFYKHYLVGHQVIMTSEMYHKVFGKYPDMTKLYVNSNGKPFEQIEEVLDEMDAVSTVSEDKADQATLFNSFRKVSRVVVLVYLALSLAMAVVVLLNLNFMFVEEKKRDLITLMVCGYKVRDACGYIWHDNLVLTILGIVLGIELGIVTGWAAVISMEVANMSLVKDVVLIACLAGAASSAVLSAIMTVISLMRIPKLQLSDINRM